jgi:hypothetical protein
MKVLSFKVPATLERKLAAVARKRGARKSALVREALERYLDESGEGRRGSFLELAGCVTDAAPICPRIRVTSPTSASDAALHRRYRPARRAA